MGQFLKGRHLVRPRVQGPPKAQRYLRTIRLAVYSGTDLARHPDQAFPLCFASCAALVHHLAIVETQPITPEMKLLAGGASSTFNLKLCGSTAPSNPQTDMIFGHLIVS